MSLFQSNLRKQIRKLPKILKFVKIIHYYSKLFTGVLTRLSEVSEAEIPTIKDHRVRADAKLEFAKLKEEERLKAGKKLKDPRFDIMKVQRSCVALRTDGAPVTRLGLKIERKKCRRDNNCLLSNTPQIVVDPFLIVSSPIFSIQGSS